MRIRALIAVLAATTVALLPAPALAATPTELFISEYIEGSSNNKALEFFNGTGSAIDLAAGGYTVQLYFNGSTTAGGTIALTGTVANGDVYVLANASANATILAQADQTSAASFYNGDDAIVLRKGGASGTILDVIGQVGVDPGTEWGTGVTSTADNTIRRNPSVIAGDTEPADAFDPAAQWTGFAIDTVDGLGAHAIDTGPGDQPAILTCGGTLQVSNGTAGTRTVTATDPDDTITDLTVAVAPVPASGTISRTSLVLGETVTAEIGVTSDVPVGSYVVTATSVDDDTTTATCTFTVLVSPVRTVGEVQGSGARSPFAPATGNGTSSTPHDVRGVITQLTLARTAAGVAQNGFFLQSKTGATDGNPATSDGIFVFMGSFTSLIGGYVPTVGDEVILRARVSEFFFLTQLSSASLIVKLDSGLDANTAVTVTDAIPPVVKADAAAYWENHEGERMRVRQGSGVTGGRDVFGSTADSEIWLIDRDDPLLARTDPYGRHVFRDPHPMDNDPALFDDGNGNRILIGSTGVKAVAGDTGTLLPPAKVFDTLAADAVGGLTFGFNKYSIQPEAVALTAGGTDPAGNNPPSAADRSEEFSVSGYNVENLYDYRDDPFDGCDFTGNSGCPGVSPPFDYVPASAAEYEARLAGLASQIVNDLHSPDLLLTQEAEDQDICTVTGGALTCGDVNNADGKPDTLQELTLAIVAAGGPAYDTANDRDGADARGIVSAFLYRTDRLSLTAPASVLTATPGVTYRSAGLAYNADVQNPKSLNALLPSDVDTSTGIDGSNVYTRAPQVARFAVSARPGQTEALTLWAVSNHFSSTPDARVGQRREQAGYGAAIVDAIRASEPGARVVYGGDLNVFPRPDDPTGNSDQLAPLYDAGLRNLWDDLVAAVPASAYSYNFEGQAQTLDHLFVTGPLHGDLVQVRSAHINADYAADFDGDGARGVSDHDPQVARFRSRPSLTVADVTVTEPDNGSIPMTFTATLSRPLSVPITLCGVAIGVTAQAGKDFDPLLSCVTVPAGQSTQTFTVQVRGDRRPEADELLLMIVLGDPGLIRLTDPIATGVITDND